ncbi:MAG TPA: hypothetical protein VHD83_14585 [Puia sp.]|nr:hypothetical protein [Puia sp.]
MRKKAIIIGAGPAGLGAAYQLLTNTDIIPVILEQSGNVEGSSTASYKTNRMDFGLHALFSRLIRLFFTPKTTLASCEQLAHQIEEKGGKIYLHQLVYTTYSVAQEVCSIHAIDSCTGELNLFSGDYFFSTRPFNELKPLSLSVVSTYKNLFIIRHKRNYHHIFKTLS